MASNIGSGGGTAYAERGHNAGMQWESKGYNDWGTSSRSSGGGFMEGVSNFFR